VRAAPPFLFVSERGSPFTTAGFARMFERAAAAAGLEVKAHPHMLRHACGYSLGAQYPGNPGMARASFDHRRRGLHGAGSKPVQGLLAGLSYAVPRRRLKSLMSLRCRPKMFPAKFSENVQTLPS
jgi:Phage integrase family